MPDALAQLVLEMYDSVLKQPGLFGPHGRLAARLSTYDWGTLLVLMAAPGRPAREAEWHRISSLLPTAAHIQAGIDTGKDWGMTALANELLAIQWRIKERRRESLL